MVVLRKLIESPGFLEFQPNLVKRHKICPRKIRAFGQAGIRVDGIHPRHLTEGNKPERFKLSIDRIELHC